MRRVLIALPIVGGLLFASAPVAAQTEIKIGMLVKAAPGDQFFCTTEADVQKALELRTNLFRICLAHKVRREHQPDRI